MNCGIALELVAWILGSLLQQGFRSLCRGQETALKHGRYAPLTSGHERVTKLDKLVGHGLGVLQHLLLVGPELGLLGLLEGTCQARNGVVVWTSL